MFLLIVQIANAKYQLLKYNVKTNIIGIKYAIWLPF
jgi:hypothetical protein